MNDGSDTAVELAPSPVEVSAESHPPSKLSAVIGLFIAFGWVLLLLLRGHSPRDITNVRHDIMSIAVQWLMAIVVGVMAFAIQRRKPAEFGIRIPAWRDVLAAVAGAIFAFVLTAPVTRIVAMPSSLTFDSINSIPLTVRIALVATAGICEEFMFRGFAIEELAFLLGRRWLAGLFSLVVFTLGHVGLYGMTAGLVIPGIIGAVVTALYLWRRNLPACMLMHAIMNGVSLLLLPALVK
jgi:CAAX protease family protein